MTTLGAVSTANEPAQPTITDVWSRTSSKYRVRAVVLLFVNLVLFAGLGCFAFWLRTGNVLAVAEEGYWRLLANTLVPRGHATLADFVLFPIRLDVIPMHGLVVGLLLAALVSIPILISILYRFPCCVPFILVVGFLAVMPWLAINLMGACILASVRPFRFRFRYASALLGLLLVLLYFYGASRQSAPQLAVYKPEDRIKFIAPWVLATIASCVIMGGVLLLAKLVNYRPGVVAPLLLVSFAVPVALFEEYVGRDELYYRLLEKRFEDKYVVHEHHGEHDVRDWFENLTHRKWMAEPEPRPPLETVRQMVEFRVALELDAETSIRGAFAADRDDLLAECDQFIRYFPDSRYAPNVLYFKALSLDMRIDLGAFRDRKIIRYYDDFPSPQSEFVWRRVVANAPDSSTSAVGRYRLALFEARAGRMNRALAWLDELIDTYGGSRSAEVPAAPGEPINTFMKSKPPDAGLKIPVEQTVFEARQLQSLLSNNHADPRYGVRPFCGSRPNESRQFGMLQLDPRHPQYEKNLMNILAAYPSSLLADNLLLRVAMLAASPEERVARLMDCIERYPNGDAHREALFRLGVAYLDGGSVLQGREMLQSLVQQYPDDKLWVPLAIARLRAVPAVAAEPQA